MEKDDYTKELGRSTWNFLDIYLKGYPKIADPNTRENTEKMILYLSKSYPCLKCRKGFEKYVSENPPKCCCKNSFKNYIDNLKKEFK